jgi:hypothetical protein
MAIASINHILVRKGVLSVEEIDKALRKAEASETGDERSDGMSPSSRDAVNFPIRLLELANQCQPEDMPFSRISERQWHKASGGPFVLSVGQWVADGRLGFYRRSVVDRGQGDGIGSPA